MRVVLLGIGGFRGKAVLVFLGLCLFIFFVWHGVRDYNERIISMELISLSYPGKITIDREENLKRIREQLVEAHVTKASQVNPAYRLVLTSRVGRQTFVFRDPGRLYDPRGGQIYALKDGGKCLEAYIKQLDSMNPYGELITWTQAKKIFSRYEKARIIDFETGLSFMVQRRAGSNHADAQPLTAEDSAIMKTIYNGKWSWRRRAIIVEVKERHLAASMNGMPHGAGAIAGNNFAGHFCIHFLDSKTHSGQVDLAHQLMVWKSAGKVGEMLAGANPTQVTRVMLTAMEQGDQDLAATLFLTSADWPHSEIRQQLQKISWLTVSKISRTEQSQGKPEGGSAELNLTVSYGLTDGTKVQNRKATLTLTKDLKTALWKIDPSFLDDILAGPAAADVSEDGSDGWNGQVEMGDSAAETGESAGDSDWYVNNRS